MKKVYDCQQSIAIGSKHKFVPTSSKDHLHLLSDEEVLAYTNRIYYKTFDEFSEACAEGKVRNASVQCPFGVPFVDFGDRIIRKGTFPDEICVWNHAREVSDYSIVDLMHELPADEFMEYLRDRGVALCLSSN
jgi:hypothetical protein